MSPDDEKAIPLPESSDDAIPSSPSSQVDEHNNISAIKRTWKAVERTLVRYNLEARGIQRVTPIERDSTTHFGFAQICILWISINLSANNVTLGMLGPTVYSLPFLDSSLCAVFGMLVGCLPAAYIATFGPRSGSRTMVFTRYVMGWWPAKLVVILTLIILIGYSIIDVVIAGQVLSAVSPHDSLSIVVGIIVTAVITWSVTTFGYSVFHYYERYAWIPQAAVLMVLAGVSGPHFTIASPPSTTLTPATLAGNRLSFFGLCLSAAITYSCTACDFFVYYPETSSRRVVFAVTILGLAVSFTPTFILGIGLGSSVSSNSSWSSAYQTSQGALIVEAFRPLGAFGSFCSVVIALGLISNLVPATYAGGIDWQALGRRWERVPRVVWNTISVLIYTVCAVAGRAHLADIFTNYLALMGYWVSIWIAIVLEEHLIFRKYLGLGWDWERWNDRTYLPRGCAALAAFVVGWVGAILCMDQVWYIGPISSLIGQDGGDLGNYVGFTWAGLVYAPLRWWEWRTFHR